jgi:hypothetical protein
LITFFDPVGKDRLSFLQGHTRIQQYRLVLSLYGNQPHGIDRCPGFQTLQERIYGTQKFVDQLVLLYGEVISPLDLKQLNFVEVVHAWHESHIDKNEFALLAKVAAWLSDLCVDHDETPYPNKQKVNL